MANLKIEQIEGIGPVLGEKFIGAGVKDTDGFSKRAARQAAARLYPKQPGCLRPES